MGGYAMLFQYYSLKVSYSGFIYKIEFSSLIVNEILYFFFSDCGLMLETFKEDTVHLFI